MKLKYLKEARRDVSWWRLYYRKTFPQGRSNAFRHLATCERNLKDNPELGVQIEGLDLRRLNIPHTPFAVVYRIRNDYIEIVRLYDMRQKDSEGFHED